MLPLSQASIYLQQQQQSMQQQKRQCKQQQACRVQGLKFSCTEALKHAATATGRNVPAAAAATVKATGDMKGSGFG
jgi:hypothetical protein